MSDTPSLPVEQVKPMTAPSDPPVGKDSSAPDEQGKSAGVDTSPDAIFFGVEHGQPNRPASPVSPTEDFEKMLSDFQSKTREHAEVWIRGENADAALDARIAARTTISRYVEQLKAENAQLRERVRGAIEVLQDPYAVFQDVQINSALARLRSPQGDTAQ